MVDPKSKMATQGPGYASEGIFFTCVCFSYISNKVHEENLSIRQFHFVFLTQYFVSPQVDLITFLCTRRFQRAHDKHVTKRELNIPSIPYKNDNKYIKHV